MKLYLDFTKVNDEEQMVYGYASTEALDSQNEKVSKSAIEAALPDYMKFANIREMHTSSAAGIVKEASIDDVGLFIGAKVVDPTAWLKVKEGVYKGFSIGGKKVQKIGDTITNLKLTEISLVDRPANPEAVFTMYKGEDMPETQEEPNIEKGMYGVARLAQLIDDLSSIQESSEWEANIEGDNSEVPSALKEQLRSLGAILVSMAQEEVSEIVADQEDDVVDEIALADGQENDLSKADDMNKVDDLQKAFTKMSEELDLMKGELAKSQERISELEAMPEPPKVAIMAVAKSDDVVNVDSTEEEPDSFEKAYNKSIQNPMNKY